MISASDRRSQGLQYMPDMCRDFDDLFSATDWRSTVTQSRLVFSNFPVPRSASIQKASHSVGNSWKPEFNGEDSEWGNQELVPFLELWAKNQDVRGEGFDQNLNLILDSIAIDRDGDVGILFVEDDLGFPKVQRIDAHRIGDRTAHRIVMDGPYKGLKIQNGVIKNRFGRVLAYNILGDTPEEDMVVDAGSMVLSYDAEWHAQSRGIPAFAAVIPELRKAKTSESWELMAQLVNSAHALVEYNDSGAAPDFTSGAGENQGTEDGLSVESYSGGLVRYFKANSGAKIESVGSARPSTMWEEFQDRIQRLACTSVQWSYELTWKPSGLNGVSVRSVQDKARNAVSRRQNVLMKSMRRQAEWAISVAMKNGYLSAPPVATDWDKFTFSMPPQMTIDPRHDSKTDEEEYKLGRKNMTGLLKKDGKTLVPHFKERINEIVTVELMILEAEEKHGIKIDRRQIQMLTPNEMAETEDGAPDEAKKPQSKKDEN